MIISRHSSSTSSSERTGVFIGKLILFFLIAILFFLRVMPQYEQGYNASLIDKTDRLYSIEEPKIVLLGNSNLPFGMCSELLEEAFHMPVVDMGLHGGLGNEFHERMARCNVQEGDLYIVCHSDFSDADELGDAMLAWITIEDHPRLWKLLRPEDFWPMMQMYPSYLKRCLDRYSSGTGNQDEGGVYARNAFNVYGDIALARMENEYHFEKEVKPPEIGDVAVNRLNRLDKWLSGRGATLLVAGYPIGNGHLTADAGEFAEVQERLQQMLRCAVISDYVDYMFDYSYFYDTDMHLTTGGAEIRTRQLIDDLQRWMSGEPASAHRVGRIADGNLSHISDLDTYLSALNDGKDRYVLFLSAEGNPCRESTEKNVSWETLGFSALSETSAHFCYCAVLDGGIVTETLSTTSAERRGTVAGVSYALTSAGDGEGCSIVLDGQEYAKEAHGWNLVVYCKETNRIIDRVSFAEGQSNLRDL